MRNYITEFTTKPITNLRKKQNCSVIVGRQLSYFYPRLSKWTVGITFIISYFCPWLQEKKLQGDKNWKTVAKDSDRERKRKKRN